MTFSLQRWRQINWVEQLTQRIIAVDLGSSHLKVVLAEEIFGRIHFKQQLCIDLQQEGLLTIEEVNRHLRAVVDELGNYPIALAIPQHLSTAHLVELPRVPEREIQSLIKQETRNLGGLSETAIIYDYHRLKPFGRNQNPFWVANAREEEVRTQINRLSAEDNERSFSEVLTTSGAMISAFLTLWPQTKRAILLDLGATTTVVAVIDHGQRVYSAHFPIGSESFTSTIAALKRCSFEEAETIKRSHDLFEGSNQLTGFVSVVDAWYQDFAKIIKEWKDDNSELLLSGQPERVILSGGGAAQLGLIGYLNRLGSFRCEAWPEPSGPGAVPPLGRYANTCGLVFQAFRRCSHASSFLPKDLRSLKLRQRMLMQANWIGFYLVLVLFLLLIIGSMQKLILATHKSSQAADANAALVKAQVFETLIQQREVEYKQILPLLAPQKKTADFVKTLQVLQQVRAKRDLWFVLFADQDSYHAGMAASLNVTNAIGALDSSTATNKTPASTVIVAELCLPDKGAEKYMVMRELVDGLQKERLFRNVDVLPPNQCNTNLVDPRLILPDRSFSLALETLDLENQSPAPRPIKKPFAISSMFAPSEDP